MRRRPRAPARARGGDFVLALGGAGNLESVDACMTRLRLTMRDPTAIDEARLKALGARGVMRPGGNALQVVLGPIADQVAGEIRAALHDEPTTSRDAVEWIAALGGEANVEDLQRRSSRLIVQVVDAGKLDERALRDLGARAVSRSEGGRIHILLGPVADEAA